MIPLTELKRHLKVRGASQDEDLVALELRAVSYVQRRLGYYIGDEEEVTEYLVTPTGSDRLWLTDRPVTPVEIEERSVSGVPGTAIVEAEPNGFQVDGFALVRKGGNAWASGYEYVVTYRRGYDDESPSPTNLVPAEIRQMVLSVCAHWHLRRQPTGADATALPHHLETQIQAAKRLRV